MIKFCEAGREWTGPLGCDPILTMRMFGGDDVDTGVAKLRRYAETGDPAELGDVSGVTHYTVRSVSGRVLDDASRAAQRQIAAAAKAAGIQPTDLPAEDVGLFVATETARRGLVSIDGMTAESAGGLFPMESIDCTPYGLVISEIAARIGALSTLGEAHAARSATPSGAPRSSKTAGTPSSNAPDAPDSPTPLSASRG